MAQIFIPAEGIIETYLKVEKVDGRVIYYKVSNDGENTEISKEEYLKAHEG